MQFRNLVVIFILSLFLVSSLNPSAVLATAVDDEGNKGSKGDGHQEAKQVEQFVDNYFQKQLEKHHVPGAVVAVVKDGEVMLIKGYGYADLERKKRVKADETLFAVGSITKTFTATAAMQLVEQGKLDLHKDIAQYGDAFPFDKTEWEPITLHHLLTHTAGLDEWTYGILSRNASKHETLTEHLSVALPKRIRPPGEEVQYSNHGLAMIGSMIEKQSGKSYEEYMQEQILEPLEMRNSQFVFRKDPGPDLAKSYVPAGGQYFPLPFSYLHPSAAGSLVATAPDMAHFMIAHLQGGEWEGKEILSADSVKEMQKQQFTVHPMLPGVAYGFFEGFKNGKRFLHHSGSIDGFQSMMYIVPDDNLGIYLSTNSTNGIFLNEDFLAQFFDHFYPEKGDIKPSEQKTSLSELKQYEGSYVSNRYPRHSVGTWLKMMDSTKTRVIAEEEGKLRVSNLLLGSREFVEIEPAVFQEVGGNERLHLHQRDGERHVLMSSFPMFAFYQAKWYEHQSIFWSISLVFLLACLLFPLGWILRKWRKWVSHSIQSRFRLWAWVMAFCNFITFVLVLISMQEILWGQPTWVSYTTIFFLSSATVLAVWLSVVWWRIQRKGIGKAWVRYLYIVVVITGLIYAPYLLYWNFIILP